MARLKINLTPTLQRLDLIVKGLVNTKFMGNYASTFKGTGLEFADYRNYTPNDDASLIDWKASHRAGKTLVKEFVEERNLNVYFLVDTGSKMMLGSVSKLKCEYSAELISSLTYPILKAGDFVGLTMFSDKVRKRLFPLNGMKQFQSISDSLSNLAFYGGESNLKKALEFALKTFEQNSLVLVLSDFITNQNISEEIRLAAKKFDLICMIIRDPIDISLPSGMGQVMLENPETGGRILISPNRFSEEYYKEARKDLNHTIAIIRQAGADFVLLNTGKPYEQEIVSFFKRRKAQWR